MKSKATALVLATAGALSLGACGNGDSSSGSSSAMSSTTSASSSAKADSSSSSAMGEKGMNASKPFGPACSSVPKSGKGSFQGMTGDPVATAASNNPALSTLTMAIKKAGLVDTLNTSKDLTVFAPANSAFTKLPKAQLDKTLADKAALTKLLTGHVVKGRMAPNQLAGEHKTLAGSTVKVTGSGEKFMVNGKSSVVCGNVQTSNATVYIIDSVLM
ncbi:MULTISPECIES: fasciclin domain-containing protein [Dermacoccus]|uniref:Fasciclin domain-containing protein n=3 Tax=Dermacoccus TaxID=57495 RepID=A0ABX5ZCF7_9MICO|nr:MULTISPECIES: fasciclin domain-containing protein [Dermacoccus]MBE7372309.1 fasciclin domain-containing protein [Dermacoccus barathri]QEH94337.1 fasciclin domain-containing protein [Dermacoccus abyssi]